MTTPSIKYNTIKYNTIKSNTIQDSHVVSVDRVSERKGNVEKLQSLPHVDKNKNTP